MTDQFKDRLFPILKTVSNHFKTPFHIYDEAGIRATAESLKKAFSGIKGFQEYFAVKALPNPSMLKIMKSMGFGFDCSSIPEILLSRKVGAYGADIILTSNNTSREEFRVAAADGGCILNLDDVSLIPKVPEMPELICFRYNPGPQRTGNSIIGNPVEAKFGVSHEQILAAYRDARALGAKRFGLHTMLASNELNYVYMVQTSEMILELAEWIGEELGIRFEFLNIGGGFGIPYKPEAAPLNLNSMAEEITQRFHRFGEQNGYIPKLFIESGRYMTGPHGVLVTKAINHKNIYRKYIGVDACMSALMRPGMYGAYHHISVLGKEDSAKRVTVDVVGSLCENNDKFAIQRDLPEITEGDILIIHDTGAHGHAMGFTYNGKLRPQELLLRVDGRVELIRRAETIDDYLSTLNFDENVFAPAAGSL